MVWARPGQVSPRFDVVAALAPVRRLIGLRRIGQWVARGVGVGAAGGVIVFGVAQLHSFPVALPAALSVLCAGAVAGLIVGLRCWPSSLEAARTVDGHFALRDRLTTALEFKSSDDTFARIQRLEAAGRLEGLRLGGSTRPRVRWREAFPIALAIVGFVALLTFAGTPSVSSARSTSVSDAQRIHAVATVRLPALKRSVEAGLSLRQRHILSLRKLDVALSRLRAELLRSQSRSAALRSVSLTQQELHRLAASLHPIAPQAAAQLNTSLSSYMEPKQRNAHLSNSSALAAASQTLSRLVRTLNRMTPTQRSQLARALARESNRTSDATLRSALEEAASSLAAGDPRVAASSLRKVSAALSGSPPAAAAQTRLSAANAQLDSLKYEISGLTGGAGPSVASSGQAGKSDAGGLAKSQPNGGKGSRDQAAVGSGQGRGNGRARRHGSGAGRGSGNGSRIAAGQTGSGGTGGHSTSGGRGSSASNRRGRYATVYSPSQEKSGPRTFQSGPSGRPTLSDLVSYQLVIAQYRRSARAALDRSSLTPAQQDTVRKYFSSISH
jgi:hypothetical protein